MTKSDLIAVVATSSKITLERAEQVVATIFGAMTEALERGERVELRGFGTFVIRSYRGYEGRNPRTGEAVDVAPKRLPFFKVGKELKALVDQGRIEHEQSR